MHPGGSPFTWHLPSCTHHPNESAIGYDRLDARHWALHIGGQGTAGDQMRTGSMVETLATIFNPGSGWDHRVVRRAVASVVLCPCDGVQVGIEGIKVVVGEVVGAIYLPRQAVTCVKGIPSVKSCPVYIAGIRFVRSVDTDTVRLFVILNARHGKFTKRRGKMRCEERTV